MEFQSLPGGDKAVVDVEKLRDYCLSPAHRDGKHKARVFASVLGFTARDAEWCATGSWKPLPPGPPCVRRTLSLETYVLEFLVNTGRGSALVRSGWIVRTRETFPRLTTCYVKRSKRP